MDEGAFVLNCRNGGKSLDKSKNVISNFFWRFAERCGAQIVAFIVSIVLARVLAPEVYGTVALVTVFTNILNVFINSGLGNALIQKKDADNIDFSTVFFFNLFMCLGLYALLFFTAPCIASIYNNSELIPLIRVLGITLLISGVKNVQQAYVSRTMQFKKFFFSTLGGTIVAAIIGIAMAYQGFGVWALVAQQLINATIDTMILWITVGWRPQRVFSFKSLKGLFSYGWKILFSCLIDTVYVDLRQLLIGAIYTTADLAYFNRGQQFPSLIVTNINASIDSVLLPTMSKEQDNPRRVKEMTRRAIKTSCFVMAPLMVGLACCARPLVLLLLTEKWLDSVFYIRIFCVTFMFYPIHTANLNAINALGRSDLFLKLELVKKIIGVGILFSTLFFGVKVMAISMLVSSVISQVINAWPNQSLLNYGYFEQIKDISSSLCIALIMGGCIIWIPVLEIPAILALVVQIVLGATIYISLAAVFHVESFQYIYTTAKNLIKEKIINRK